MIIAHFDETAEPGLVEVQKYIEALELGKQDQFVLQRASAHHMEFSRMLLGQKFVGIVTQWLLRESTVDLLTYSVINVVDRATRQGVVVTCSSTRVRCRHKSFKRM